MSKQDKKSNQELLNLVSSVKARIDASIGNESGLDFPIPQFIIVGSQSVGKSRLIESLAGETFNFVCGTLGSRRPTVLEFRNTPENPTARWYLMDEKTRSWGEYSVGRVSELIGQAHESLGNNCTDIPVRVKVESAGCVDLGLVDLPGFRDFAMDASKQDLSNRIEAMVTTFMKDENNVMICVEQAGDAANLRTLSRCKKLDPDFKRTILVRNKLDKYYRDLSSNNINEWLNGFGDLPDKLEKFALSLPHWDGNSPPKPFLDMRAEAAKADMGEVQSKGASQKYINGVGFDNFRNFVEKKTQVLFAQSLNPLLQKLRSLKESVASKKESLKDESEQIDERNILHSTRSAGSSFANAFQHIMEGILSSDCGLMTLREELQSFNDYCDMYGIIENDPRFPDERFKNLDEYEEYLRKTARVPGMDSKLNGGAQFRRMLHEVEVFFRFATIEEQVKARDVANGLGDGNDVHGLIVKLLSQSPRHMIKKVGYVAARVEWFFSVQKDPVLKFMVTLKGSPEEHMYSQLYYRQGKIINANETMKACIYKTYDDVLKRQKKEFQQQYMDFLNSMFQHPMVMLKASSVPPIRADEWKAIEEECLPSWEETKERIPQEFLRREDVKNDLKHKIRAIQDDADKVPGCQKIIAQIFSHMRRVTADQMELYTESFFLLPMMRRLEGDMNVLELQEEDQHKYRERAKILADLCSKEEVKFDDVTWCIDAIQKFKATANLL